MRPDWRILIDGQDRSEAFRARLLSLTITDESGYYSDTVSVRLDDRDGRIVLPRLGVEMVVQLGYEEIGRVEMGRYTVDEIELSGPPDTLFVRSSRLSLSVRRAGDVHYRFGGDGIARRMVKTDCRGDDGGGHVHQNQVGGDGVAVGEVGVSLTHSLKTVPFCRQESVAHSRLSLSVASSVRSVASLRFVGPGRSMA